MYPQGLEKLLSHCPQVKSNSINTDGRMLWENAIVDGYFIGRTPKAKDSDSFHLPVNIWYIVVVVLSRSA